MNYFFMNECIFKTILINHKNFVLKLLESINITIKDYELFDINEPINNTKVDILLFTNDTVINIQLNKNKNSLLRNKIYIDCISKILTEFNIIQININRFPYKNEIHNGTKIYNLYNNNEYIKFITTKNYLKFKTKNKYIKEIIKQFKNIDYELFKKQIENEQKIKRNIDNLIKE